VGRDADCDLERRGAEQWAAHAQDGTAALLTSIGAAARGANAAGHTNLMLAAKRGDGEAVAALLRAGAAPRAADASQRTALHYALEYGTRKRLNTCRKGWVGGHVRCVAALVAALQQGGAGAPAADGDGGGGGGGGGGEGEGEGEPHTLAEVLQLRSVKGGEGWTPVQLAALHNNHLELGELLRLLRAGGTASGGAGSAAGGGTAAAAAAVNGAVRGGSGDTALTIAARNGYKEVTVQLLEAGAAVGARSSNGMTPLHWCARGHKAGDGGAAHTAAVAYLLSFGADVEATAGASGVTPLLVACQARNADAVRVLVHHGAGVNARTVPQGLSPLMLAVSQSDAGSVAALLAAGADAEARNPPEQGGFNALDIARDAAHKAAEGSAEVLRTLEQHVAAGGSRAAGVGVSVGGDGGAPSSLNAALPAVSASVCAVVLLLLAMRHCRHRRSGGGKARSQ